MSIKILPVFLANQIAAGEVIERPSSVLKELLENSLDAGSDQITIRVEKGGVKRIEVIDNGSGITKEDLPMALVQHATSKIKTLKDLEAIQFLGFRGEALSSIGSVARIMLSSKPAQQEMGWSISIDQLTLFPILQPNGTTVRVEDLFYNIPARRKFLRSAKTEFLRLEGIFKRLTLSHFKVAFALSHNGKERYKLSACKNDTDRTNRLSKLFGRRMVEYSVLIDVKQNGLRLWGWLGLPADARSQSEHQFFYVNRRIVKDRLINHAINQVCQSYCALGKYLTYCLYFEIDVNAIDVNVHPTKHEVRFRDVRIIHAFLTRAINDGLKTINRKSISNIEIEENSGKLIKANTNISTMPSTKILNSIYNAKPEPLNILSIDNFQPEKNIQILCILGGNQLALAQVNENVFVIDLKCLHAKEVGKIFSSTLQQQTYMPTNKLLIPQHLIIQDGIEKIIDYQVLFARLGFQMEQFGENDLLVREIPILFKDIIITYIPLLKALTLYFLKKRLCSNTISKHIKDCVVQMLPYLKLPNPLNLKITLQLFQNIDFYIRENKINIQETQFLKQLTVKNLTRLIHQ